jgi:hypothetical protein
MQSLAQKKAKENFKKAIEYRKKTGCTLKQAFAHIKGKSTVVNKKATPKKKAVKKVAGYVKTIKKGGKTEVLYTNAKNAAKLKKPSEKSILNKIHKVKKDVDNLNEAQHKHMSIGNIKKEALEDYQKILNRINIAKFKVLFNDEQAKLSNKKSFTYKAFIRNKELAKKYLKELETHAKELKKHI